MHPLRPPLLLAYITTIFLLFPSAAADGHTYGPNDFQCIGGPVVGFQPCGAAFYIQDMDGRDRLGAHFFYTQTEAHCVRGVCTPPLPWCTDWGFVVYGTWRDYEFVCALVIFDPLAA